MEEGLAKAGLRVRQAAGAQDLARVLALRAAAFPGEPGDDPLDQVAVHLMVERGDCGDDGQLLASARVLLHESGTHLQTGYAARSYDLSSLAADPRPVVELGRIALASVALASVKGGKVRDWAADWQALRLLFGAVARLVLTQGAARLLGCASFPGSDWRGHAPALAVLARDHLGPAQMQPGSIGPAVDFPALVGPVTDEAQAHASLPPLLRFYLGLGGWVSSHAVADPQLDTLHVLTCVEVAQMDPRRTATLKRLYDF